MCKSGTTTWLPRRTSPFVSESTKNAHRKVGFRLETAEKDQIDVIEEKRTLERKYESEINEAKVTSTVV